MHCSVSGCGDVLCKTEDEAIAFCKRYLAVLPENCDAARPDRAAPVAPKASGKRIEEIVPADENKPFDMMAVIREIIDEGSWLEIKALFAREILTGFARIDGRAVGHRRQPAEVARRRPLRRLRRQGGALHLAVRRVQRPAALPRRRAGLHDRHEGRAAGDHPRGREDDRRRERGDACRSSASSCARPTARGSTRCAARRSSRTRASRCRARRSP